MHTDLVGSTRLERAPDHAGNRLTGDLAAAGAVGLKALVVGHRFARIRALKAPVGFPLEPVLGGARDGNINGA